MDRDVLKNSLFRNLTNKNQIFQSIWLNSFNQDEMNLDENSGNFDNEDEEGVMKSENDIKCMVLSFFFWIYFV